MGEPKCKVIIIDTGSDTCKVGLAGDQKPKCLMPTQLGRHENPDGQGLYLGFEAQSRRSGLAISCPYRRGEVTDWGDMQRLWEHAIQDELGLKMTEHTVLLADTPNNTPEAREKMAEIFFESFQVPALMIANKSTLALYSAGRMTGTVVDIGHTVTSSVPVYDGYSISENVTKVGMGGADLTDYLLKLLSEKNHDFSNPSNGAHLHDIKEQLGYVALDFQKELETSKPKNYELPDGQVVTVAKERFQCPEALFQPKMLGLSDGPGLPALVHESIERCDPEKRNALKQDILLCGGSSLFEGVVERLSKELSVLGGAEVTAIRSPEPLASPWIGGSVFASLATFAGLCVARREYLEEGAAIVHKKCPK